MSKKVLYYANHPAKAPFSLVVMGSKKRAEKAAIHLAQRLYLAISAHQETITQMLHVAAQSGGEFIIEFGGYEEDDDEREDFCDCGCDCD